MLNLNIHTPVSQCFLEGSSTSRFSNSTSSPRSSETPAAAVFMPVSSIVELSGIVATLASSFILHAPSGNDGQDKPLPPDGKPTHIADDRFSIDVPTAPLLLSKEVAIPLKIKSEYALSFVSVEQRVRSRITGLIIQTSIDVKRAPVLRNSSNEPYINVTPTRLGSVEFEMSGRFSDGGTFQFTTSMTVEAPADVPKRLVVGSGTSPDRATPRIALSLDRPKGGMLIPNAIYEGTNKPFELDDHFVHFTLRTPGNKEVIHMDAATGRMTPLSEGHAVVATSFGGATTYTCVVVLQDHQAAAEDRSSCSELLRNGEKLPNPE